MFIPAECACWVPSVIVSLSGIRADTLDEAVALAAQCDRRGVPLSLLVAPRLRNGYRLSDDPTTLQCSRKASGDVIVLHGYDQAAIKRRRAEFATLPEHEATLRLTAADRALEHLGLRTRLFAPPRWVISPGALAALPRVGFTLCADRTTIRDLATATMVHSRLLGVGLGGGSRTEPWRCRAMVLSAGRTTRHGGLCRVGIDARHLSRGRTGGRFRPGHWPRIGGGTRRYSCWNRQPFTVDGLIDGMDKLLTGQAGAAPSLCRRNPGPRCTLLGW